jgi:hypothetical protein
MSSLVNQQQKVERPIWRKGLFWSSLSFIIAIFLIFAFVVGLKTGDSGWGALFFGFLGGIAMICYFLIASMLLILEVIVKLLSKVLNRYTYFAPYTNWKMNEVSTIIGDIKNDYPKTVLIFSILILFATLAILEDELWQKRQINS